MKTIFSKYGDVTLVRVLQPGKNLPEDLQQFAPKHPELSTRVCAVVELAKEEQVQKAIKELSGSNDWRGMQVWTIMVLSTDPFIGYFRSFHCVVILRVQAIWTLASRLFELERKEKKTLPGEPWSLWTHRRLRRRLRDARRRILGAVQARVVEFRFRANKGWTVSAVVVRRADRLVVVAGARNRRLISVRAMTSRTNVTTVVPPQNRFRDECSNIVERLLEVLM